jgi:hypothetical protein
MSKHSDLSVFGADAAQSIISNALAHADDGEIFIERQQSESLAFDDGRLRSASFDESEGFGLRAVSGEMAAYAHSSRILMFRPFTPRPSFMVRLIRLKRKVLRPRLICLRQLINLREDSTHA